ncbi:MAG: hypothetical protein WD078_06815 [Woeseia sp.]
MEAETVEAVSNSINWELILALVGACAWIPIAIGAVRKWIIKPKLDIVIGQQAEVSYTTNSTVCNLEIAARVHNKPALITRVELQLQHAQGRSFNLNWTGLSETPLRSQSTTGDEAEYTRTLNAVAVQVLPNTDVVQRKVLFSDTAYRRSSMARSCLPPKCCRHRLKVEYRATCHVDGQTLMRASESYCRIQAQIVRTP